jgi:hypothetical protein
VTLAPRRLPPSAVRKTGRFPGALERRPGNLRRSDSLDVVGTSVRPYQKASLVAVKGWGGMVFWCASSERPTHGDQGDQSQWFVDQ